MAPPKKNRTPSGVLYVARELHEPRGESTGYFAVAASSDFVVDTPNAAVCASTGLSATPV